MSSAANFAKIPAVAGAAQVVQRPGDVDLAEARGPIELMVDAVHAAAQDAGAPALLRSVGWVGVAGGWFRYRNPGQLVAERIGAPGAATVLTSISGTAPQDLLGLVAGLIASGKLDVGVVVGGEARWSHRRLKRAGLEPRWVSEPGDGEPAQLPGFPDDVLAETRALGAAATAYALFEDSLRSACGESVEAHRDRIAELWARFSVIAGDNPWAWDPTAKVASAIREPTAANRMISFPYTKAMVANNTVDMASAILICSVDAARAAGVATDRLVFPHVVTSAHETWKVINRGELHGVPALATAGRAAFDHAGIEPNHVEHIDLYACFPAIVQMSALALGLDLERPLSLTGGLGFAGGAVGNAAGHSIAAMVPRVRGGGFGLVHGNGGNATKHTFAVYSNQPPRTAFARLDCQDAVHHGARDELETSWSGRATVEAATVVYDRDGPSHVFAAVRDGNSRGWAVGRDEELIADLMGAGLTGRTIERTATGELRA